ncbi:hypothetical protein ADK67_34245 [Saccharothrix sp. NRRL B-16348]|uniref:hypothetical protein n=1 Tax=Saccharothrix sp. NRRL B-16348 TaxID=1415542 RepID=UPI0006AF55D3|nr:hypothetical protein [Saccharothrix sp. NRRL B-16348]KOX19208.1 hypothetical protein ADK67_34245 [Saccharothrix sp. NRRL B-16348]
MNNPLVATAKSDTTAVTGIGIAESANDLAQGISDGSWVAAGLGGIGVGLEVLSMVLDPIGTVASYGVSWLIEHVQPLKEALDWFAGDPPVIRSFSETWSNVAAEVTRIAEELGTQDAPGWQGAAADTYRGHAAQTADAIAGAGTLADGVGTGVMIMGEVVAAVREIIRDLVAEVVGKLITWALEAVATLGLATPLIVAQATSTIAKVCNRIADLVRKLVKTIGNVTPRIRKVLDKLGEIMEKLGKLGRRADSPSSPVTTPGGAGPDAPTVRDPDAPGSSHDDVDSMSGDGQDYDNYLANDQGVVYRDDRMSIGNDPETQRVRDNVRNEGHHDVVLHGSSDGWPVPGHGHNTHPEQIVEAIRNNPHRDPHQPIRLLACHSGNDVGWAQHVADRLGVPVMAPVDAVGVARRPDSIPRVRGHEAGEGWRWFLPNYSGS